MQASFTKRITQSTLKLGSRALQQNAKYLAFAQPAVQQSTSMSLTPVISRGMSEQMQFDKVTSYESLISRISNANNVNDLLNIMNQNFNLYKNEHVVLTLRVLARLVKSSNQSQVESLQKDERYQALTKKAQENLEEFNEYEILDFLFWLRRFRGGRLQTNISEENLNKLYAKVKDFVKSKSFNFRNLVNLFYDLSCLNKNTDDIAGEILNELKADSKLLTPFTIVQILQACSMKKNSASPKELSVADYVQRNLNQMLQEFDSDQKCLVFKYLSALEMHINPPRYRVPHVLFNLRTQLKDILDQLSEVGVINILEAYAELPREFPSDLLDEIKEMVIVTIQHNSENIKSFFLVDFLDKILNLSRGRKVSDDKIIIIYEEITKRLLEDDYIGRFRTIERIIEIYDRAGINYDTLLERIYQRIDQLQTPFFSGPILQSLNKHGKDVTPILDKFIAAGNQERMGFFQRLQLYLVLTSVKSTKYDAIKSELKTGLTSNAAETYKIISHISEADAKNAEIDDLLEGAIESLKAQKGNLPDSVFYRSMFLSAINKKARTLWIDWIRENIPNAEKIELTRSVDALFSLKGLNSDRILLFTSVLETARFENFPFRRFLNGLKDKKDFTLELMKFEGRFTKVLARMLPLMDHHKSDLRLQPIYSLVKRMENVGVRSHVLPQIARKAYEITKASDANLSPQFELIYTLYLLEHGVLRVEDAKRVYDITKKNIDDISIKTKLFAYILQKSPAAALESEEIINEINENLQTLQGSLSETGAKTVLTALSSILAFPPQFLEPNKDLYVKSIKSFLNFANQQLYLNLITALPATYVKKNYDFYLPFIRELITNYNNFNKRMYPSDLAKVLRKFADINTKNPTIYNYILTDIGRVFNSLRSEELADVVNSFSKLNIKQTDLFDKIVVKVGNYPQNFSQTLRSLLLSFFRVGFNSQQAKSTLPEIFSKVGGRKSATALAFALYVPILNIEGEAEILQKALSNIPENVGPVSKRSLSLLYDYLRIAYKNQPELAEAIKKTIPDFDATRESYQSNALNRARKTVEDYLKAMKVDYQTDYSVDGFGIDLYIPATKNLVKIYLLNDVNFDKFSLTGKGLLTKKVYQSFDGYKATFINMAEFNSTPEHMNRINYLTATGIENNNTEGTYDFSHIQQAGAREEEFVEEVEKEEETEPTAAHEEDIIDEEEKTK